MASLRTTYGVLSLPRWKYTMCLSAALVLCCGLVLGCSSADDAKVADDPISGVVGSGEERARFGTLDTTDLNLVPFDLNTDGSADQIHYLRDGEPVRVERDLNFDGVMDTYEHYKGAVLVEVELDLDLDGTIDVVVEIVNGQVASKRYSMGFRADMVIAQWFDSEGRLQRVERDTDDNGVIDLWEHFKPGETNPFRREIDTNGDGKPDKTRRMDEDG